MKDSEAVDNFIPKDIPETTHSSQGKTVTLKKSITKSFRVNKCHA